MNSAVTTVTKRDVSLAVTRSCCRDRRDTPLWGVTFVTLTQPRANSPPRPGIRNRTKAAQATQTKPIEAQKND